MSAFDPKRTLRLVMNGRRLSRFNPTAATPTDRIL
jgi:hypothetical protein